MPAQQRIAAPKITTNLHQTCQRLLDSGHGSTHRHLFDLADWDPGLASSAPGQSGQPGSPHDQGLLPMWAKGQYLPLAYSPKNIAEIAAHQLRLKPARSSARHGGDKSASLAASMMAILQQADFRPTPLPPHELKPQRHCRPHLQPRVGTTGPVL
jgi:hypothetical protein